MQQEPAKKGLPLGKVQGIPAAWLKALKEMWITTAEEFVSAGATPGGRKRLLGYLRTSEEELSKVIDIAAASLAPLLADEMSKPVDAEYGLGALEPEKRQNEKNGKRRMSD